MELVESPFFLLQAKSICAFIRSRLDYHHTASNNMCIQTAKAVGIGAQAGDIEAENTGESSSNSSVRHLKKKASATSTSSANDSPRSNETSSSAINNSSMPSIPRRRRILCSLVVVISLALLLKSSEMVTKLPFDTTDTARTLAHRHHESVSKQKLDSLTSLSAQLSRSPDQRTHKLPSRPDWLESYIEFHRSSIERDGPNSYRLKPNIPYVVYECKGGRKRCGGIGDRINSMNIVLYLAMCSGRVLLIDSPYPSPLQNFLEPNEIRWDALPPTPVDKLPVLEIMDVENEELVVDPSIVGYRLGRCNGMPPKHTLKTIWNNQCMANYFDGIGTSFPYPYGADIPQEKLLRWSFWTLFKFSDAVLLRAEELKDSADLVQSTDYSITRGGEYDTDADASTSFAPYLGLHVRTGDKSMEICKKCDAPRSQYTAPQQQKFVECYQRFRAVLPDTPEGYVASDSVVAKRRINKWEPSIGYANNADIFHVDLTVTRERLGIDAGSDEAYRGSLDGWAELVVLVDAACLVMSWSMFSFAAHYIGGDKRCGVYVEDCTEENVIKMTHQYFYESGTTPMIMVK